MEKGDDLLTTHLLNLFIGINRIINTPGNNLDNVQRFDSQGDFKRTRYQV